MALLQCKYGLFDLTQCESIECDSLRRYGEFGERLLVVLRRFLVAESVVADVGASVGAYAVAFARIVGERGHVHAFGLHGGTAPMLERNVALNRLTHTVAIHAATGDDEASLDAAGLPRLDLIRIGPDADAVATLRLAAASIASCRPVIVMDGKSIHDSEGLIKWVRSKGYKAFTHIAYMFNPENYRGCNENVFGQAQQVTVILVPEATIGDKDLRDLHPSNSAVHLAQQLAAPTAWNAVNSPEFPTPVPGARVTAPSMREQLVAVDLESRLDRGEPACLAAAVHIVVPFYKRPELVGQIFGSLNAVADEIKEIGAKVFFYNDSPDYEPLQAALDQCRFDDVGVGFEVIRNASNLGFIGTCNAAFTHARAQRADVILLNSDTMVFPGAFREIRDVATLDPMIGFVSPRSNNATLATLPHGFLDQNIAPDAGYAAFLQHSAALPRYVFVPTAVGFCLFVKWSVYSELGAFDPIYGAGYNEENDLVMRANRAGYRAVLANKAFVWHQGEQSFGSSPQARQAREEKNAPILNSRYPEYLPRIHAHFSSPEYRAEDLIGYASGSQGEPTIAFDFSTFGPYFNGTFESGIRLLEAAVRTWPAYCRIGVYMSPIAWEFHGLARLDRVFRLDVEDPQAKVSAILRIGQPFDVQAVERIANRAPVLGIFMLDTISYDCGYLSLAFDAAVWRHVFEHVDVLFTNSRFTLERIASRFKIGPRVMRRISRHSLDVTEYAVPSERAPGRRPHIFVIGNHFSHKFVRPTVDALAAAFPDRKIVAVGYGEPLPQFPHIECYESGNISNETFERFYSDAEVVIFPSHYEGFGFPILHSLARKRPIYVRDSALYRELACDIAGAENIQYFCTLDGLVEQLQAGIGTQWIPAREAGERNGWDRSAREVFHALEQARSTLSYDALVERLRQVDQLGSARSGAVVALTPARLVGRKVEVAVERLLRVPGVRPVARRAWRVVRRMRTSG